MITQQVASYLIKKMDAAVQRGNKQGSDTTDELFQSYLAARNQKSPANVLVSGRVDNDAVVEAFRWRAADLSYQAYQERIVKKRSWNSLLIQLHRLSNGKQDLPSLA